MKEVLTEYGGLLLGTLGATAVIRLIGRLILSEQGSFAELVRTFFR